MFSTLHFQAYVSATFFLIFAELWWTVVKHLLEFLLLVEAVDVNTVTPQSTSASHSAIVDQASKSRIRSRHCTSKLTSSEYPCFMLCLHLVHTDKYWNFFQLELCKTQFRW